MGYIYYVGGHDDELDLARRAIGTERSEDGYSSFSFLPGRSISASKGQSKQQMDAEDVDTDDDDDASGGGEVRRRRAKGCQRKGQDSTGGVRRQSETRTDQKRQAAKTGSMEKRQEARLNKRTRTAGGVWRP